jgi:hypothetical protein
MGIESETRGGDHPDIKGPVNLDIDHPQQHRQQEAGRRYAQHGEKKGQRAAASALGHGGNQTQGHADGYRQCQGDQEQRRAVGEGVRHQLEGGLIGAVPGVNKGVGVNELCRLHQSIKSGLCHMGRKSLPAPLGHDQAEKSQIGNAGQSAKDAKAAAGQAGGCLKDQGSAFLRLAPFNLPRCWRRLGRRGRGLGAGRLGVGRGRWRQEGRRGERKLV